MSRPAMLSLPRHRWSVWLALVIALFSASAPTLSHAVALIHSGARQGIEICTGQGPRMVAVDTSNSSTDSSPGQDSVRTLSHCPFCLHNADRVAPPPSPVAYLFLVPGGQQEATVWQAYFYVAEPFTRASPRGPPTS